MGLLFKNNAETTLSSGINNSVTTVPVASAAVFPTPDANNVFFATIEEGNTIEVVKVTGISSNNLTVVRAQDNTSAAAFSSGSKIELRLTAKILEMGTSSLTDLDGDTQVLVEEAADEDKIKLKAAGTEIARIDSTGLGIGGINPTEKLHVDGTGKFNDGVEADHFKATGSIPSETSANTAYLDFASGNARIVTKGADGSTQGGFQILQQASDGSPNNTPFHISSGGEIGIGTTDPDTDGYDFAEDLVIKSGASASDGVGITLQSNTRRYGVLAFGDSADTNAGEMWYDHTLNSINMRTAGTQRFSLDSSGNAIYTGNVTAYGSPSDLKLKENIEVIENALDKVKQLKGVTYDLKSDGNRLTGLIAQDLEKVLPEAVYTSQTLADGKEGEVAEEHLAIRYGNTVGLLVEAIKEQQEQIDTLNDYVKLQSATIMDMERRLNELEDK